MCNQHDPLRFSPDEQSDGERGRLLVWAGAGLDGEGSTELGQHPGLGRGQPLQMLLGSTGHCDLLFCMKLFSLKSVI